MTYLNDTGLPSVTDVISGYIDSQWFTEDARDRGTAVHEACFSHIKGDYVIPLKPAWRGYFDSFRRWCDHAKPKPHFAEVRLIDDQLKFCGQMDFAGEVEIRDGAGLIDWKTSLAVEKWFRLQGAAYRHLAGMNGYPTVWGGNLRLKADGAMPLFNEWPPMAHDFSLFIMALNLYYFFT